MWTMGSVVNIPYFSPLPHVMCGFVTGLDLVHLRKSTICWNHHRRFISAALLDQLQKRTSDVYTPEEPLLEDLRVQPYRKIPIEG